MKLSDSLSESPVGGCRVKAYESVQVWSKKSGRRWGIGAAELLERRQKAQKSAVCG